MPRPLQLNLLDDLPPLHTARLHLRALTDADAAGVLCLRSDPAVVRYLGVAPLPDLAAARVLIAARRAERDRYESCTWVLCLTGTDELIGTLSAFAFDERHRKVEIGYSLLPAHWRQGYVSEGLRRQMSWLYDDFGAHRLTANIDPANRASAALLRKLHFRREGYFRQAYLEGERYTDCEFYGRLRSDGV